MINRYAIQDKMVLQWAGTQDTGPAKYALNAAQTGMGSDTVDQNWRWLTEDFTDLYDINELEAATCLSWCHGWITGATSILNKSVLGYFK